jgi:hypothetical protein
MGDQDTIKQVPLGRFIELLPGLFCVIGDCAYTPTEHLVPIFIGAEEQTIINNNFNYFDSKFWNRTEMVFVKKRGILH